VILKGCRSAWTHLLREWYLGKVRKEKYTDQLEFCGEKGERKERFGPSGKIVKQQEGRRKQWKKMKKENERKERTDSLDRSRIRKPPIHERATRGE